MLPSFFFWEEPFLTSFTAIKKYIEAENNKGSEDAQGAQAANIVPRFPVMQLHNGSYNGTHFNGTLTAISTAIPTECAEETEIFTTKTSAEATTTMKKTLTQTRTIQESGKLTTVSSALAVPETQSGTSTTSQ